MLTQREANQSGLLEYIEYALLKLHRGHLKGYRELIMDKEDM